MAYFLVYLEHCDGDFRIQRFQYPEEVKDRVKKLNLPSDSYVIIEGGMIKGTAQKDFSIKHFR